MTLILAVEEPEKNRAVMFCDSGVWRGNSRASLVQPKAWRSNGWIVGCSGMLSGQQTLRRIALPELSGGESEGELVDLLLTWAQSFHAAFGALKASVRTADPDDSGDSPNIVVAHDSRVWGLQACGIGRLADGFEAAGARDFAMAGMYALSEVIGMRPFDRGVVVMKAAEKHTDWAVRPFRWIATDGTEGVL